jgi:LmbE family N-acetylglucosaminyl deacetylase
MDQASAEQVSLTGIRPCGFRPPGGNYNSTTLSLAQQRQMTVWLEAVRPWKLQLAASVLGISSVAVASFPDGRLRCYPRAELTERVRRSIRWCCADLLVVVDPEAGDPDEVAVAMAAYTAAAQEGVPVVACTGPGGRGAWMIELGAEAATARAIQKSAVGAHVSQCQGLPELTRRIDLLDGREYLRWLVSPDRTPEHDRAGRRFPGADGRRQQ